MNLRCAKCSYERSSDSETFYRCDYNRCGAMICRGCGMSEGNRCPLCNQGSVREIR